MPPILPTQDNNIRGIATTDHIQQPNNNGIGVLDNSKAVTNLLYSTVALASTIQQQHKNLSVTHSQSVSHA
jgi:hypothetical protein